MRTVILLVNVFTLSAAILCTSKGSDCGIEKCFHFKRDALMFSDAADACAQIGGKLASISDFEENQLVNENAREELQRRNPFSISMLDSLAADSELHVLDKQNNFWIGGISDDSEFSEWRWVNGDAFNSTLSRGIIVARLFGGRCLQANRKSGRWFAQKCETRAPYVCETVQTRSVDSLEPWDDREEPQPQCELGWIRLADSNSCYRVFSGKNWIDAEQHCVEESAHLASIHSKEEHEFLVSLVDGETVASWRNVEETIWIGAHSPTKDNRYVWTDGSTWNYDEWGHDEPNHLGEENCVQILTNFHEYGFSHMQDKWNNLYCDRVLRSFVCKKQLPLWL